MSSHNQLEAMADDMGISLYQRFTEKEAASFLQMQSEALSLVRTQRKISYLQIEGGAVEYFGIHLLNYLLGSVKTSPLSAPAHNQPERILRNKEVTQMTGLSRTTIWRMEQAGDFPKRVSLGVGSVGWKMSEVDSWVSSRNA